MRRSEIFENFVKVAQENGLVSSDDSFRKLENNPRADSLSADDIKKLYNITPNTLKEMSYKSNIMEIAHKEPVVVSSAYDKLNGLVENNIERSNIMQRIVHKPTNGLLTNTKYAQKELLLSLVRIANDLDNNNNVKLQVLADSCLKQASYNPNKPVVKTAGGWLIATGVAALVGAVYVQQHTADADKGFRRNHENLVEKIDDLISDNSDWGWGYDVRDDFKDELENFKDKLNSFYDLYDNVFPEIQALRTPRTTKEYIEYYKDPSAKKASQSYLKIAAEFADFKPYLETMVQNLSSEGFKSEQKEDEGVLTTVTDSLGLHGGKGLFQDKFDTIKTAVQTYMKSVQDQVNILKSSKARADKAKRDIQNYNRNVRRAKSDAAKYRNPNLEPLEDASMPEQTEESTSERPQRPSRPQRRSVDREGGGLNLGGDAGGDTEGEFSLDALSGLDSI